jgi:hypothetical protein
MSMLLIKCLAIASCALPCLSYNASAQDSFPEISFEGLVDVRAVQGSGQSNWLDRGLGKTRYGTASDGSRSSIQFSEASLIANVRFSWDLTAMAHIKFDPEQKNAVDLVEAYIKYDPVSTSPWRIHAKAGMFFPPISLEHSDVAWTSPYSLTPSAINTWVGEEIKATGLEVTFERRMEDLTLSLTGAAFMLNDPTGTLLAWRGWALHDIKATALGRFALPDINSIKSTGIFNKQAPWIEPHHEIDNRVGYYVAGNWEMKEAFTLSALYYNNRGNPIGFDGNQYSWGTNFFNLGLITLLPGDVELLAQYMKGNTIMGPRINEVYVLDMDFSSYYILLSKMIGEQRLSLRYDNFKTDDLSLIVEDNNNEAGHAWMASLSRSFDGGFRLMMEMQYVDSDRASRLDFNIPTHAKETQLQFSFRYSF